MSTYIRIVRRHVLHNEMGKTSYLDLREEYIYDYWVTVSPLYSQLGNLTYPNRNDGNIISGFLATAVSACSTP